MGEPPKQAHLPLQRLWHLSTRHGSGQGLLSLQDLPCVHLNVDRELAQMYREVDRLRLSHLWRVSLHLSPARCVYALRPQHPQEMLRTAHESVLQVSNLQQESHEYGEPVPESGCGDSEPAYASRVPRHHRSHPMQRLLRQEHSSISLAGIKVLHLSIIQHCGVEHCRRRAFASTALDE